VSWDYRSQRSSAALDLLIAAAVSENLGSALADQIGMVDKATAETMVAESIAKRLY
jgi:hypothetical protein